MADPIIWKLGEAESDAAGAVLARPFLDEPVLVAAFGDQALLERYLPLRIAAVMRYALRFGGEAWAIGTEAGKIAGVAICFREPTPERTPELTVELRYPVDPEGDAGMARANAIGQLAESGLGEMPPVWRNLIVIGVDPAHQGKGLGSALLRRLLADAAAAGETLALFTDRAVNVPFYERAGMRLVWSGTSDDGTVPLWAFRAP